MASLLSTLLAVAFVLFVLAPGGVRSVPNDALLTVCEVQNEHKRGTPFNTYLMEVYPHSEDVSTLGLFDFDFQEFTESGCMLTSLKMFKIFEKLTLVIFFF